MMTLSLPDYSLKVDTDRFGPFLFQIGCEASQLETLRETPWYIALYSKLTDKTARRDLNQLKELKLMTQNESNEFLPCI